MTSQAAGELISLPQGGGAMQGIGETFQPDLHTGTAHLSVPITLPPGRSGMEPKLALSYSSGAGNGPFGLGWNIDVPGVRRKTAKGVPRYDGSDVFVLSGAEDLVPVPGGRLGEQRYRPRVEGLFARISRYVDGGQDHWEVWSKDGLRSRYGTGRPTNAASGWRDPATVADPRDRSRVLTWLLTETTDTFGNRVEYAYDPDPSDPTGSQRYLTEIRYADWGDRSPARFLVTVRLRYERRPDAFCDRRGGFGVQTTLRCTRIETWTHDGPPCLSRSIALAYTNERGAATNGVSLLTRVLVRGHDGDAEQDLPALDFGYTTWAPEARRYQPFLAPRNDLPATALGRGGTDLVDLFGEALPSVLQLNGVARYWRNRGDGRFDPPRPLPFAPSGAELGAAGTQLADFDGDGRTDLLVTDGPRSGYFPISQDGGFDPGSFVRFRKAPGLDLTDPEVRLIDLSGDGAVDAVRTGLEVELYFNDHHLGWTDAEVRRPAASIPVSFSDPRMKLADMTGDGLTDVVLVHDGLVEYWPNLGHGRWGDVVVMAQSPRFADASAWGPTGYDPRRLLVGDIDGDGCADLVYVGDREITVWVNRGGNSFSPPLVVRGTPPTSDVVAVRLADMMGAGVGGIFWSYDAGTRRDSTYKFLDLTGGVKPYLLASVDNHMGARTQIEYSSSTRYALDDASAGHPWRTSLPFPVQVVARTTVTEAFSGGRQTSAFRYHHGYWDGAEREFRGFARVDQFDAEEFSGAPPQHYSPPTEARTWFHIGPVGPERGGWTELDLSDEHWLGDASWLGVTDTAALPSGLPRRALRDAVRALAGRTLRTELYARDGEAAQHRPYDVTEHRYGLAAVLDGRPGGDPAWRARPVFFAHPRAERVTHWERGGDPLTQVTFTDRYDDYGRASQRTEVSLPRGGAPNVAPGAQYLATTTVTSYATADDGRRYFADRVAATARYELVDPGIRTLAELHGGALDGTVTRRMRGLEVVHYDGPAFEGLALGQLGDHGVPIRTENLVFTAAMIADLCPAGAPSYLTAPAATWPAEYPEAFRSAVAGGLGYVWHDAGGGYSAGWYVQSKRTRLDIHDDASRGRGLVVSQRDPLGNDSTIAYDLYRLLPMKVTDPVGLETSARYDYRLLRPSEVTDPNGNRAQLGYTPLGLVAWSARMAKPGVREGDTPEQPGVSFEYRLDAWDASDPSARQPVWVHTTRRIEHRWSTVRMEDERRASLGLPPLTDAEIADLFPGDEAEAFPDRFVAAREFSDGLGRALQSRAVRDEITLSELGITADPDVASAAATGYSTFDADTAAVAVSGSKAYDNKGRVVQAWEPSFGAGWEYAPGDGTASTVTHYDARGAVVRVVHPDGSEERTVHGVPHGLAHPDDLSPTPWETYAYDANDNGGRTHPSESAGWSDHWNTPSSTVVDALGRVVQAVTRTATERFVAHTHYDIDGRVVESDDALGRRVARTSYDLLGRSWVSELLDAGLSSQVLDATGAVVERRDAKGAIGLEAYDAARRLVRHWCRDAAGDATGVTLRGAVVYAEDPTSGLDSTTAAAANLLGRPWRTYDEAGRVSALRFDVDGNLVEQERRVLKPEALLAGVPGGAGDWSGRGYRVDWQPPAGTGLDAHAEGLLDAAAYATVSTYDALGRRTGLAGPTDVEGKRRTIAVSYGRSGRIDAVSVDGMAYLAQAVYNARGQRLLARFGNGLMVRYAYDPLTFRLRRLRCERCNYAPNAPTGDVLWLPAGDTVQDHGYEHDLVGNLVGLHDRTPGCGVPPAGVDRLDRVFRYDPLYRLVSASGREVDEPLPPAWSAGPRGHDPNATRPYREDYTYDPVGNLLRLAHGAASGGTWNGAFTLVPGSNRLQAVTTGSATVSYAYDACGNLLQEAGSRLFEWDAANRLATFRVQAAGAEPSVYAHYRYDGSGQRVMKLVRQQGGSVAATVYVEGVFERLVLTGPSGTTMHDTLHAMDSGGRIATIRIGLPPPGDPTPAVVYQLGDHLGSSEATVDSIGALVGREEYSPYGQTTFGSYARKRYRFTGKEQDEESGLNYHGARYYAPWLCRWTSCDPAGHLGGVNLFRYADSSPLRWIDLSGAAPQCASEQGCTPSASTIIGGLEAFSWSNLTDPQKMDRATAGYHAARNADADRQNAEEAVNREQGPSIWSRGLSAVQGGLSRGLRWLSTTTPGRYAMSADQALRTTAGDIGADALYRSFGGLSAGARGYGPAGTTPLKLGRELGEFGYSQLRDTLLSHFGSVAAAKILAALPAGLSASTAMRLHHIATREGRWAPEFEQLFSKAGMTVENAANKVSLPYEFHKSRHGNPYHIWVYGELLDATENATAGLRPGTAAYRDAYREGLETRLNELGEHLKQHPEMVVPDWWKKP